MVLWFNCSNVLSFEGQNSEENFHIPASGFLPTYRLLITDYPPYLNCTEINNFFADEFAKKYKLKLAADYIQNFLINTLTEYYLALIRAGKRVCPRLTGVC